MTNVGFIGLGHMGYPMVVNLLKANCQVKVFDINAKAVELAVAAGAKSAKNIAELSADADVIFTMLQSGEQVKSCVLGEEGVFANINNQALYIDSSSIDVKESKEIHQVARDQGIAMLDAPVSGGVAAAEAATLTFMVGGSEKDFNQAKSLLECLGKNVIYAGGDGAGEAAKICNNMILGVSMIAVSEAFQLADKLGLEPQKLYEICSKSSGQCWSLTTYCPWPEVMPNVPSSNNYQPGFAAKMMLKDLNLSQAAAKFADVNTALGKHATKIYQEFVDAGNAEVDFSGVLLSER